MFFSLILLHLMMITIMVQGCGGSETERGSDLIFDHMSVETKVWLASWALSPPRDPQIRSCFSSVVFHICQSDEVAQFQH